MNDELEGLAHDGKAATKEKKSSRKALRALAVVGVVLAACALVYGAHFRRQLEEARQRNARLLGGAAAHVEAVLESSLTSLFNLSCELDALSRFEAEQPFLSRVITKDPLSQTAPCTQNASFDRSLLTMSIGNLAPLDKVTVKSKLCKSGSETKGLLGTLRPQAKPVLKVADGMVELEHFAEDLRLTLDHDRLLNIGEIDPKLLEVREHKDTAQSGALLVVRAADDAGGAERGSLQVAVGKTDPELLGRLETGKEVAIEFGAESDFLTLAAGEVATVRLENCGLWILSRGENPDSSGSAAWQPIAPLSARQTAELEETGGWVETSIKQSSILKRLVVSDPDGAVRLKLTLEEVQKDRLEESLQKIGPVPLLSLRPYCEPYRAIDRGLLAPAVEAALAALRASHEEGLDPNSPDAWYLNRDAVVGSRIPRELIVSLRRDHENLKVTLTKAELEVLRSSKPTAIRGTSLVEGKSRFSDHLALSFTISPDKLAEFDIDLAEKWVPFVRALLDQDDLHVENVHSVGSSKLFSLVLQATRRTSAELQLKLSGSSSDLFPEGASVEIANRAVIEPKDCGYTFPLIKNGGGTKTIDFKVRLDRVLAQTALAETFDSFLVAGPKGAVLFQQSGGSRQGLRLESLADIDAAWKRKVTAEESKGGATLQSTGPVTSQMTFVGSVPGTGIELTCQPIRPPTSPGNKKKGADSDLLKLCGLSDSGGILKESLGLAPHLTALLVLAVFLGCMSWPFAKFLLMDPLERLRQADVLFLLVGTFWSLVVLTLIVSSFARYHRLEDIRVVELRDLAVTVEKSLNSDLDLYAQQLGLLDEKVCDRYDPQWGADWPKNVRRETSLLLPPEKRLEDAGRVTVLPIATSGSEGIVLRQIDFDSVFWAGSDGRQLLKGTIHESNTQAVSAADRGYFKAVQEGRTWPGRPFFFQSLTSITTGKRSAVLAIPSNCEDPSGPSVAALVGVPPSLRDPIVSSGRGFAIIDRELRTQFHTDKRFSLAERFDSEVTGAKRLRAVVASRSGQSFNTVYRSRPHRFYVQPLDGTPWWIVTFFDKEMARTIAVESALGSLLPFLYYSLVLGFVIFLLRKRMVSLLWPSDERLGEYAALFFALILLLFLDWRLPSGTTLSWALVHAAIPLAAVAVCFLTLSKTGRHEDSTAKEVELSPTADAAEVERESLPDKGSRDLPRRIVRTVHAGAKRVRQQTVEGAGYKVLGKAPASYVLALFLLWSLITVAPVLNFSAAEWTVELSALAKRDVLTALDARKSRNQRIKRTYTDVSVSGSIEDFLAARGEEGVYLYSSAGQLLGGRKNLQPADLEEAEGWTAHLARWLPIYNNTTSDLRYIASSPMPEGKWIDDWSAFSIGKKGSTKETSRVQFGPTAASGPGRTHALPAFAGFVALISILAVWVWYMANHLCFSRARQLPSTTMKDLLDSPGPTRAIAVVTSPKNHQEALDAEGFVRIDISGAASPEIPADARAVVLVGLEAGIEDKAARAAKFATLAAVLEAKVARVLLLTSRSPFHTFFAQLPTNSSTELCPEEARQWSRLLASFELRVVARSKNGEEQSLGYYWNLWSSCSDTEKISLVQLVDEGFLNPKQLGVVEKLMQRGLVERKPRLEIADGHFADFLRRTRELRLIEESATTTGGWRHMRFVLGIVVLVVVAFLFLAERDSFNNALAVLTALGASIPLAFRILGSFRSGGSPPG